MNIQSLQRESAKTGFKSKRRVKKNPHEWDPARSRRAFLKLPLLRRRAILRGQAAAARGYYEQDDAWKKWDASELT